MISFFSQNTGFLPHPEVHQVHFSICRSFQEVKPRVRCEEEEQEPEQEQGQEQELVSSCCTQEIRKNVRKTAEIERKKDITRNGEKTEEGKKLVEYFGEIMETYGSNI